MVTGATGFLGSALCRRLEAEEHEVTRLGSRDADLRVLGTLDRYTGPYERIYHLAAWTQAGDFCLKHSGDQWVINQLINTHVLDWWLRAQPRAKLVSIGTSCSYDPTLPLCEENYLRGDPIDSLYTYAYTKRMLLIGQMALQKQHGLNWLTLVPSTLYGQNYHTDGRQMHFVFDLIRKILRGKLYGDPVVLWGDGEQKRELIHVEDFVTAALRLSVDHDNELINVGAGSEHSIRHFARLISTAAGYDFDRIQFDKSRYVGARSKLLETTRLQACLPDWRPIDIEEGLRQTISWFMENRAKLLPQPPNSRNFKIMKILITGGAGYIGSVLTPHLLASGHDVTVVDNFMFGQNSLADCCRYDGFQVVRGDCRDEATIRPLLASADVVIPLAALVGAPMCKMDPMGARTINQEAVEMLCNMAEPRQRILMPVTNSGYGIGEKGKFCTEETPLNPISLYGVTKVAAERAVLARENSITFRLATVFGMAPRMRIDLLVNDFVHRAVIDRAVLVFEGHFKRNYIHIQDVARVFSYAIDNFETMKGRPYNVGLEEANLSKLELCAAIKRHLPGFVYIEAPVGEDPDKRDYVVSNQRLLSTGFRTEWGLDRGIKELIKGYTILRNSRYGNV